VCAISSLTSTFAISSPNEFLLKLLPASGPMTAEQELPLNPTGGITPRPHYRLALPRSPYLGATSLQTHTVYSRFAPESLNYIICFGCHISLLSIFPTQTVILPSYQCGRMQPEQIALILRPMSHLQFFITQLCRATLICDQIASVT